MQKYFNNIADPLTGMPIQFASVSVQNFPSGTAATYYATNSTGTPLTVALETDANGMFQFYAADGRYQLVISKAGITPITIADILLEDPVDSPNATLAQLAAPSGSGLVGDNTGGGLWTTVKGFITYAMSSLGSSIFGHIASGTGSVATTVAARLNIGSAHVSQYATVQDALNEAAVRKVALDFSGTIVTVSSQLTMPTFTIGGRTVCVPLISQGGYATGGINYTGTGACFKRTGYADALFTDGFIIQTTTGGGFEFNNDMGGLHLNKFYMNGCAAGEWSVNFTGGVVYTVNVDNSRMWANSGYFGGVFNIPSAINFRIANSFISQQRKDGDISVIGNCKNFYSENTQYEGGLSTTTAQSFYSFTGNCFNITFVSSYLEGYWDKFVKLGANSTRQLKMIGNYAWNYSKPDCLLLDAPTIPTDGSYSIEGLEYINNSATAATLSLINDPLNLVTVTGYHNSSSGNQASRLVKQIRYTEEFRSGFLGQSFVAAAGALSYTFTLPLQGMYSVHVCIDNQDYNHGTLGNYVVAFDSAHANNYASSQIVGAVVTKGASAPTALAVAVATTGVVTVTATQTAAGSPNFSYYWKRLVTL